LITYIGMTQRYLSVRLKDWTINATIKTFGDKCNRQNFSECEHAQYLAKSQDQLIKGLKFEGLQGT
jgi:hypothetical protein